MASEDLRIDSVINLPFYASAHAQPGQHLGPSLPRLGLGVYKNEDPKPAVLAALKHGYRHIDTARMYRNEPAVGQAVRESGVPRGQVFVTSKVMATDHGYEDTLRAVDDSLQKFGYDYFDLYLIHSPLSGQEKRLGTWRALIDAKNAGKVKSIGVSNYSGKHIDEIRAAGLELPSVNQIELHPLCQQRPIVKYCQENGIVVEAYSPLARSKLGGPVLQRTTKLYNKDIAQIAVRWSLQHGFVPLPKASHRERILSNSQVYDFELSDEDMAALDALDKGKAGSVTWNPVDAD
ncbi:Aldo/keto reductase [Dichomitus squalens LYAD-421 SS1]|uniref:Aldo/keto reductase n=1 Tax=Dichomitus squalens (strain LYAD-421) TaxID=732165 RepID=R7SXH3_DICSQ|nr:Aldo/keto reductase [Dichomitus squalens LYAD-421 SS1]EJF60435.1 Aldo/keto reductase [Dichomitus squalens LYAD-421 SS1]